MRIRLQRSASTTRIVFELDARKLGGGKAWGGLSAAAIMVIAMGGPTEPPAKPVPPPAPKRVPVSAPAVQMPALGEPLPPMGSPMFNSRMRALGIDPKDVETFARMQEEQGFPGP